MESRNFDSDVYDDEAFLGNEEGEILDGEVLEDLDGADEDFDDDEDDDHDEKEGGQSGQMDGVSDTPPPETLPDESLQTFGLHKDAVMAVAWHPSDTGVVATGSCDDHAYIWRVGEPDGNAKCLAGHGDTVAALGFEPGQGAAVATGGMDGVVKVWESATGQLRATLEGPGEAIMWLQWHPKGSIVLAGSEDMTAWMWNVATQQCMQVFVGHSAPITAGGFTYDGRAVVTCSGEGDGSLRAWNPKTGECSATIAAGHGFHDEQGINCVAFSTDPGVAATGGMDASVVISNVAAGRPVAKLQGHSESVECVGFAEGRPLLVSAGLDGLAIVWDTQANSERGRCEHPEGVVAMSMQARGPLFATGCIDGVVRVWDVRTSECVAKMGGNTDTIQALAFGPDDEHILTGGDDGHPRVFKLGQTRSL